jgi:hypothetical protein
MAITPTYNQRPEYSHWKAEEVKIIGDRAVRFRDVCVVELRVGDVDDPDLYVGQHIWEWQQTPAGQFVMAQAVDPPYWVRATDHMTYGHVYRIVARLAEPDELFWTLKWGSK